MELETGWRNNVPPQALNPLCPECTYEHPKVLRYSQRTNLAHLHLRTSSPQELRASWTPTLLPISYPALSEVGSQLQPILRASLSFLVWPQSLGLPSCPTSLSCLQFPRDEAIQALPSLASPHASSLRVLNLLPAWPIFPGAPGEGDPGTRGP